MSDYYKTGIILTYFSSILWYAKLKVLLRLPQFSFRKLHFANLGGAISFKDPRIKKEGGRNGMLVLIDTLFRWGSVGLTEV